MLLQANAPFTINPNNKLMFSGGDRTPITVELLRGGEGRQLKLRDANTISLRSILPMTCQDVLRRPQVSTCVFY